MDFLLSLKTVKYINKKQLAAAKHMFIQRVQSTNEVYVVGDQFTSPWGVRRGGAVMS